MALIKCKDCGKDMSTDAKACPNCGASPPKTTSRLAIGVAGFIAIAIGMSVYNGSSSGGGSATSAQPAAAKVTDPKEEARFQAVVAGARLLKSRQKNPASFSLEEAVLMADGAMCYQFRGTNSFNAVVPGHWVIVPSKGISSGEASAWNKYCARKSGTDYGFARQAL